MIREIDKISMSFPKLSGIFKFNINLQGWECHKEINFWMEKNLENFYSRMSLEYPSTGYKKAVIIKGRYADDHFEIEIVKVSSKVVAEKVNVGNIDRRITIESLEINSAKCQHRLENVTFNVYFHCSNVKLSI